MRKAIMRDKQRNKVKVLLLGGGTQALIISKQLKQSGCEVHIFDENRWTYSYHTRYAYKRVVAPPTESVESYLSAIHTYITKCNIDVLFPMNDETARLLSIHKEQFNSEVKFVIPDAETFELGYNKNSLMRLCAELSIPHPKTVDLERSTDGIIEEIVYPALIKPNHMTGGRGMKLVQSADECKKSLPQIKEQFGPCHLQEFIPSGGRQIKVQVFLYEGEVFASSVIHKQRYYPENGGSSSCCVTIEDDALVQMCAKVLSHIGWVGFADFDLIEDPRDGVVKIMEINPRVPACIKAAINSGVDYANMVVDASIGAPLKRCQYTAGSKLRHIGFEMLWFLYSKNRFHTNPNWFDFFSPRLSFQDFSWSDPMPFIFGTIGNILKMTNSNFRKAKSGLR